MKRALSVSRHLEDPVFHAFTFTSCQTEQSTAAWG